MSIWYWQWILDNEKKQVILTASILRMSLDLKSGFELYILNCTLDDMSVLDYYIMIAPPTGRDLNIVTFNCNNNKNHTQTDSKSCHTFARVSLFAPVGFAEKQRSLIPSQNNFRF